MIINTKIMIWSQDQKDDPEAIRIIVKQLREYWPGLEITVKYITDFSENVEGTPALQINNDYYYGPMQIGMALAEIKAEEIASE